MPIDRIYTFRDIYRNKKGEYFLIVMEFITPIPIERARSIWPRGTACLQCGPLSRK